MLSFDNSHTSPIVFSYFEGGTLAIPFLSSKNLESGQLIPHFITHTVSFKLSMDACNLSLRVVAAQRSECWTSVTEETVERFKQITLCRGARPSIIRQAQLPGTSKCCRDVERSDHLSTQLLLDLLKFPFVRPPKLNAKTIQTPYSKSYCFIKQPTEQHH